MIEIAGAQEGIAASPEIFDADPHLLGVNTERWIGATAFVKHGKRDVSDKNRLTWNTTRRRKARPPEVFSSYIFTGDKQLLDRCESVIGHGFSGL